MRNIPFLTVGVLAITPFLVAQKSPAPSSQLDGTGSAAFVVNSTGLVLSSSDGANTVRVHGYIQADNRMFLSNIHGEALDAFLFRRIRPVVEATVHNTISFHFIPDFGQNNPQIQEAYAEWKTFSFAELRAGKIKEPLGLELDRSDRDVGFVERSLVSDLLPSRYMGAEINGSLISSSINYAVGYFNGSSDGSSGNFQWLPANEFAGRVFLLPFKRVGALRQLGMGLGGSSANQHGVIAGLKTVGQNTFFKYSASTVASGSHWRISPQAYYFGGPVSLIGEYAISSQDVASKNNFANVTNQAWHVSGSVMLTGEKNSFGSIRPRHNFEPMKGLRHWGAFELAARYSQLQIGSNAFPLFASPNTAAQEAKERAIGMNWYLNRFVKLVIDYEHTEFRMAPGSTKPLHDEDVLMNRIQLSF